jgi:hypothetical protein
MELYEDPNEGMGSPTLSREVTEGETLWDATCQEAGKRGRKGGKPEGAGAWVVLVGDLVGDWLNFIL